MAGGRGIQIGFKAVRELGIHQTGGYALYRFGLASGHYRLTGQAALRKIPANLEFFPIFQPARPDLADRLFDSSSRNAAAELLAGWYQPYGGPAAKLDLACPPQRVDWTLWKPDRGEREQDIKDVWEPARFGWAIHLAEAYRAGGDEAYPELFRRSVEVFCRSNPPYTGPQWSSAQEVALRLIHWCACASICWAATAFTPEFKADFARQMAIHAARIPFTLVYARAQNNNHLLSEAAGLFTAGQCLKGHPEAGKWSEQGWHEFEQALITQIDDDGTYSQQSVCYHRLMLTLALWMNAIRGDFQFSINALERLRKASLWLDHLTRGLDGKAPNLGSNDGSLILPFGQTDVTRYDPVVKTALTVFCGKVLDEQSAFSAWFARQPGEVRGEPVEIRSMLRMEAGEAVGFLRTAGFHARPGHADQLHFDLWWHGDNILRDAGTFRYNAPEPWQNSLAGTDVHNTIVVDGRDQMTRAGQFLWVDRANIEIHGQPSANKVAASHDGYRRLGVIHRREVGTEDGSKWCITDRLEPVGGKNCAHSYGLNWLLPDALPEAELSEGWKWSLAGDTLTLCRGRRSVRIRMTVDANQTQPRFSLYHMGQALFGDIPARPTWGWYSPTYGLKEAALDLVVFLTAIPPVTFTTEIVLEQAD